MTSRYTLQRFDLRSSSSIKIYVCKWSSILCCFLLTGEELGVPNYAVPYLAPNSTGKAILYGVNYASGGGGIMNASGRIFVSFL